MNYSGFWYLPKYFTEIAIGVYLAVLTGCLVIFPNKLPLLWITFGAVGVIMFFYFLNLFSRRWAAIPDRLFQKKIFRTALIIRVIYIVFIYFFYQIMTGKPFEFDAADSVGYHGEAVYIIALLKAGLISDYFTKFRTGISDSGFPLFLSVIYFFLFNSILVARLLIALLSARMCVLLYRLALRTSGFQAARITAVMAMLLPTFIYYAGLHTKETVMVFVLVAFAERADYLLRSPRIKLWVLLQVVLLGSTLFFFRTVLAVAAWFALFSALLFSAGHILGSRRRTIYLIWFVVAAFFVLSGRILTEVKSYTDARDTNQGTQMQDFTTREGGNRLAKYGSKAIFMPLMVVAPLPTLVNVAGQENAMMINGAVFVHNIYAFFVILAILSLLRRKLLSHHVLIIAFLGSYLFILASSGFALSERFHVPTVPFLLLLAGYGVTQLNKRYTSYYVPYLIIIAIAIIGWNWFKLAGRGLV